MFYKIVENGKITMLGAPNVPSNGVEISEEKYNQLMAVIQAKPDDTLENVYELSNATEKYEPRKRTHEETVNWYVMEVMSGKLTIDQVPIEYKAEVEAKLPAPEQQKYTLDEAASILAQEVSSNVY